MILSAEEWTRLLGVILCAFIIVKFFSWHNQNPGDPT